MHAPASWLHGLDSWCSGHARAPYTQKEKGPLWDTPKKDRYGTRIDNPMSKKTQFLHILALVGGGSQDGPYSPLRNSEFWDPRKPVANGMASGEHGPGATGFICRTPGARVDVPGARTNIGAQQHMYDAKQY